MHLTKMNTLFLLLSAYLFTYIDGLSIFNRILKNDYSQKQYWPRLENEENIDISDLRNNHEKRATDLIPNDVYNQESNSPKDNLRKELNNKLYKIGALFPYYTQPSRQDLLNGASDLKPKIINCLEKVPEQIPSNSKSKKLCDDIFECFSSLPRIGTKFARSLTFAIIPRCKIDDASEKSKRAPWAGAERRYDSMADILRSRISQSKRSNSRSKSRNLYDINDEDIMKRKQKTSFRNFPMSMYNIENSNGVKVKGYGHLPVAWYKKVATRSENNRFETQDSDKEDQLFNEDYKVLKNKEKRMPENVADGGDSVYPLAEGTIGDFANDLALDTYASMLQQEYRQARADGTEIHSNRHIRPFVG